MAEQVCTFCNSLVCCACVLPWHVAKDSDSKADPLIAHHIILERGDDGWDEGFDPGEAGPPHTPRLVHQKDNVRLPHGPACWGEKNVILL